MIRIARASAGWFVANLLSSVINFLAIIYFSRTQGASTIGTYFMFFSALMVLNFLSNGGLSSATIKRISEGKDKYRILTASLLIRSGILFVLCILIVAFRGPLQSYLKADVTIYILGFLFLLQFTDLVREFLQGTYRVALSAFIDFFQQLTKILSQLALLGHGLYGLIWGLGIGFILSICLGVMIARPKLKLPHIEDYSSLIFFSKYSYGTNLGGLVYEWLGILAVGYFLSNSEAGIYGVCWSISAAFLIFGQAISSSIFPEISSLAAGNNDDEIATIFNKAVSYGPFIALPGFFGALALGKYILQILYGSDFASGFDILVVLMATRVIQSVQGVIVRTIEGLNRPDIVFKVNAGTTVLNIVSALSLIAVLGAVGAALSAFVTILVSMIWNLRALQKLLHVGIKGAIVHELAASIVMYAVISFIAYYSSIKSVSELMIVVAIGAGIYLAIMAFCTESRQAFRNLMR